jgi:hypothetical protein
MMLIMHWCGFELVHQYFDNSHHGHTDPICKINSEVFKTPKFTVAVSFSDETPISPILHNTSFNVNRNPIISNLRIIVTSEHPIDRPLESFPNKASPA